MQTAEPRSVTPSPALPPFATVLKSRDVEDPVNLWVHRPLAYAIVALIYRTAITPNQITLLALLVGGGAGVLFLVGTKTAMLLGGLCLWSSAILDGADGILARAKRMFSDVGRAIDGAADGLVGALTVLPAFYHIWITRHSLVDLAVMPIALLTALVHVYSFDYYKEAFLQHTSPSWNGTPERLSEIARRVERLRAEGAPWYARLTTRIYLDLVGNQIRVVSLLNPVGLRHHLAFPVTAESTRIYRTYNRGPMQLWAFLSTAPHCYLMSLCAMFDRLDIYLWLRVVVANIAFVVVCVWQRKATQRTLAAWTAAGLAPHTPDA
ncbi:MAG: CDP-alcohol phosphatidyltransferase family protein [Polyangiales bacterium]